MRTKSGLKPERARTRKLGRRAGEVCYNAFVREEKKKKKKATVARGEKGIAKPTHCHFAFIWQEKA